MTDKQNLLAALGAKLRWSITQHSKCNTRRILDLLEKHDTQATFFVLGWIAERVPDLVREIEQRGHEITDARIFAYPY